MEFIRHFVLLILLVAAPVAGAQSTKLYKWTDEEGNIHYSQIPPTDREAETLTPPKDIPATPATAENGAQTEPAEDAIPEEAKQDTEYLKAMRQNCEIAKQNLQTYKAFTKIRQPDGSVVEMSPEMREAKIKEAEQMVESYCK